MEAYLGTDGTITLQSIELQLTIHCTMDFKMYPFDQQVSCKIPQSRAMMNISRDTSFCSVDLMIFKRRF